ncbi:hypothetical protein QR680_014319 [Steinernema hermaphroditum]|uniref:Uncharacterized protein n=1 Tax=Steinernema hermaphroditum TaxID=289476 RepID=A0AA39IA33_9BILA|nr:hypothetical protein QR680_014319 [Steinernema hermaphroditum]
MNRLCKRSPHRCSETQFGNMVTFPLLLSFLWIFPIFSADKRFDRMFQGGSLTIKGTTTNCDYAGTDSTVTASLNYINAVPNEDYLIYTISTPAMIGHYGENLERGTRFVTKYDVPDDLFAKIEDACYDNAIWPIWSQSQYEDCFHPNLLYFQLIKHGSTADWKPGNSTAYLVYSRKNGDMTEIKVDFKARPNCDIDWVHGRGDSYLCRDEPSRVGNIPFKRLKPGSSIKVHPNAVMRLLIVLALLFAADVESSSDFTGHFRGAELTTTLRVRQSQCYFIKQVVRPNTTFSFGYVDSEDRLRYHISTGKELNMDVNTFEMKFKADHKEVDIAERNCVALAQFTDQALYEDCMKFNTVFIEFTKFWKLLIIYEKVDAIEIEQEYTLSDGSTRTFSNHWNVTETDCARNQLTARGVAYIRFGKEHIGKFMPRTGAIVNENHYP